MIPNEQEIREAVKELQLTSEGKYSLERMKAVNIFFDLAQSYLSASKELPERMSLSKGDVEYICPDCGQLYYSKERGHNSCLDQVTPILAKKNEEVAMLKKENEGYKNLIKNCPQAQVCPYVKTISFTPDLELAKKVIEEQREELEACRDANVQKKKRIATLEDALKRAEGEIKVFWFTKSVENGEETIWLCFPNSMINLNALAEKKPGIVGTHLKNAIHALLATRKGSEK